MLDIFLVNTRKEPFLFSLYHDLVCRHRKACSCKSLQERNADGKATIRRLPASCQIEGGCASDLLPAEVFHVHQVRTLLSASPPKLIRVSLDDWKFRGLLEEDWYGLEAPKRLEAWKRSGPLVPETGKERRAILAKGATVAPLLGSKTKKTTISGDKPIK